MIPVRSALVADARRPAENALAENDVVRERLIDAAEACFKRFGVMKTTVEDIAAAAGVSRATVYRYATGRDELILGVLLRSADRFFDRLGRRLGRADDVGEALVEGILYTLDQVRTDENLTLLFAPEAAGITGSIAGAAEALFRRSAEYLAPLVEAAQGAGQLRADIDAGELAEWLIRVILSLLTVQGPRPRTRAQTRALLHDFLVPALIPR